MIHPSKRTAAIAQAEAARLAAFHAHDVAAFSRAVAEIKKLDAEPDVYTCPICGKDFGNGPHADLLVASILIFGDDGAAIASADYGLLATEQRENGRRFKFCGACVGKWKHPPLEYAELR